MSDQLFQLAFHYLDEEPRAAARLLETSDTGHVIQFFSNTPAPTVVRVLREMQPEHAAQLLIAANSDTAQLWMQDLRSRVLSAIFRRMPAAEQQVLLNKLTLKKKAACQLLLSFREDMIGAIIETDIIVFPVDMTVEDGIKRLKQRQYTEDRLAFVIDSDRKLRGEVSIPQLLRGGKTLRMGDIQKPCDDVISSRSLIRSAVSHPVWRKRDIAAVINRQRELIGVLWYNQLRRALSPTLASDQSQSAPQESALDVLHAHGESMRALVDALFKASR